MYCHNCGAKVKSGHKFCYQCGDKLDYAPPRATTHVTKTSEADKDVNYRDIFYKVERTLKGECCFSEEDFQRHYGKYRNFHYKQYSDDHIWWILVAVVFYSGMKAAIVTSKLPALKKYLADYRVVKDYDQADVDTMMRDNAIIKHKKKIEACIRNAEIFNDLIQKHGSFASYLERFGDLQDKEVIETIRQDLRRFAYIGPVTAYHVMLDLGFDVWKPDRVMCRILERLGLISDTKNIDQAVDVGREFVKHVSEPIRYIDIVMVKYGQEGNEDGFGLLNGGICLERNPRCSICGIREYCRYRVNHK